MTWRGLGFLIALSALALASPLQAVANPFTVETFDQSGVSIGSSTLYERRQALLIRGQDGAATLAERLVLDAWLAAHGFQGQPGGSDFQAVFQASDKAESLGWIERNDTAQAALSLIIIDAPVEAMGGASYILFGQHGHEGDESNDDRMTVRELLDALDRMFAPHVVVIFTGGVAEQFGRARQPSTGDAFLTANSAKRARQIVQSIRPKRPVLEMVSQLFRGDLNSAFDADGYLTFADLERLEDSLKAFTFGSDAGGEPVVAQHQSFESAFGKDLHREDRLQAYLAIRGVSDEERYVAYLKSLREDWPDAKWARARLAAIEAGEQRQNAEFCDKQLTFDPRDILGLGPAVVGDVATFHSSSALAKRILSVLPRASGLSESVFQEITEVCAGFAAPEQLLQVALLTARSGALTETGRRLLEAQLHRTDGDAHSAVLAGLDLLAEMGAGVDAPEISARQSYKAVIKAAEAGHPQALFVRGLIGLELDPALASRPSLHGMAYIKRAADNGMPLARAVFGMLSVSQTAGAKRARSGYETDILVAAEHLRLAERRGVEVARALVDADAVAADRRLANIQNCESALDFDPYAIVSVSSVRGQSELQGLLNDFPSYIRDAMSSANLSAWRNACAEALGLALEGRITSLSPGQVADLRVRAALAALSESLQPVADKLLSGSGGQSPIMAFAEAATARPPALGKMAEAARAGSLEASIYLAVMAPRLNEATAEIVDRNLAAPDARDLPVVRLATALRLARSENAADNIAAAAWLRVAEAGDFAVDGATTRQIRLGSARALARMIGVQLAAVEQRDLHRYRFWGKGTGGVIVRSVTPNSLAEQAGLVEGAIITYIDSEPVRPSTIGIFLLDRLFDGQAGIEALVDLPGSQVSARLSIAWPEALRNRISEAPMALRPISTTVVQKNVRLGPGNVFPGLYEAKVANAATLLPHGRHAQWRRILFKETETGNASAGYVPVADIGATTEAVPETAN